MKTSDLGVSAMYRILKKAGADRVSDESAEELRRVLEAVSYTHLTLPTNREV